MQGDSRRKEANVGKRQNSEEDLAWRSLVEYACGNQASERGVTHCTGYLAHPFAKLTTSPTQPIYVLGTELD